MEYIELTPGILNNQSFETRVRKTKETKHKVKRVESPVVK